VSEQNVSTIVEAIDRLTYAIASLAIAVELVAEQNVSDDDDEPQLYLDGSRRG
jgi:hypothetical protein